MSLLSELYFWGTQDDIALKDTDYCCKKYVTKKSDNDSINLLCKKTYFEQRGLVWSPQNKRPIKLKDRIRELEELLYQNKVVGTFWNECKLTLLLSRGAIVNVTLHQKSSDITNISFDKSLCSKLQNEIICNGIVSSNQVIFTTSDGRTMGHGSAWREPWILETGHRKNLTQQGEFLAIWGKTTTEHPQPWSPLARDHQRANIHLYWVGARGPDLVTYKKTDGEPFALLISKRSPKTMTIVEQKVSTRGQVAVEVSVFEILQNNTLKRSTVTAVPLQTQLSCCKFSYDESRLLLACIDGTVAVLNRNGASTKTIKINFIPTMVTFNKTGVLICLANEKGQIQYLDFALNTLNSKFINEEITINLNLSTYFSTQPIVDLINWNYKDLLVILEHGPIVLITHDESVQKFVFLIDRYLKNNMVNQCINLLIASDWNESCFIGLQRVVNFLLRKSMTEEVAQFMQRALGCFHSPEIPLSTEMRHRYGMGAKMMTRRFFHQLIRSEMYETAFLLAVDLAQHDLFMDLYYIAVNIGETEMAAAARAQASALLSRCSSEASMCSRSSCSQCSDTSSSCSNEECQSPDNVHTQRTSFSTSTPQINNENYLTTNFNSIIPKTSKPVAAAAPSPAPFGYVPPIPNIDLPKINLPKSGPATNKMQPLLYQTPIRTSQLIPVAAPIVPPVPVLPYQLGIPVSTHKPPPHYSFQNSKIPHFNAIFPSSSSSYSDSGNFLNSNSSFPLLDVKSNVPPLPTTLIPQPTYSLSGSSNNVVNNNIPSSSQINKKPQAKVKFSDTVTAFIVPEVKRPVRPALPSHMMDPQKELADSLPLCSPNEDYLKDFTPVRKNDNEQDNQVPPKIKVVHFGVV